MYSGVMRLLFPLSVLRMCETKCYSTISTYHTAVVFLQVQYHMLQPDATR